MLREAFWDSGVPFSQSLSSWPLDCNTHDLTTKRLLLECVSPCADY